MELAAVAVGVLEIRNSVLAAAAGDKRHAGSLRLP